MISVRLVFTQTLFIGLLSLSSLFAQNAELRKAQKASDEWRATYKFNKNTYDSMQAHLKTIIDTDAVIQSEGVKPELVKNLRNLQKEASNDLVAMGKKVVPYLLREFANNYVDRSQDWSKHSLEVRKAVRVGLQKRRDSLQIAVSSFGLKALPDLIDFYARSLKADAQGLARDTKKMIDQVVTKAELDLEKAKFRMEISERPQEGSAEEESQELLGAEDPQNEVPQAPAELEPLFKN